MSLSEAVEPVIGLTAERWDVVVVVLSVVLFTCGFLIAERL